MKMKIEEIKLAQEKLTELEDKIAIVENLNWYITSLTDSKYLNLATKEGRLWFSKYDVFEFIGKEIIELLESKKLEVEKEIHNFTLDQLLPKIEIENNGLGIKFRSKEHVHEYYYRENVDGVYAIISGYSDGNLTTSSPDSYSIEECEKYFRVGDWIKL